MTAEHKIQNEIRNALAGKCMLFRANVGTGWTSSEPAQPAKKAYGTTVQPGDVVLRKARRFDTGLPVGFSDLFGMVEVEITPDMVGKRFARFIAPEVKQPGENPRASQAAFLTAVSSYGGVAGVVRSVQDAFDLLNKAKE